MSKTLYKIIIIIIINGLVSSEFYDKVKVHGFDSRFIHFRKFAEHSMIGTERTQSLAHLIIYWVALQRIGLKTHRLTID